MEQKRLTNGNNERWVKTWRLQDVLTEKARQGKITIGKIVYVGTAEKSAHTNGNVPGNVPLLLIQPWKVLHTHTVRPVSKPQITIHVNVVALLITAK